MESVGNWVGSDSVGSDMPESGHRLDSNPGCLLKGEPLDLNHEAICAPPFLFLRNTTQNVPQIICREIHLCALPAGGATRPQTK